MIAFWLVEGGVNAVGYGLAVPWAVLPTVFFAAAFIIGHWDWFGRWKWLAAPLFGLMYTLTGHVASITADDLPVRNVIWPDFSKLPVGLLIPLAGLELGMLCRKRQQTEAPQDQATAE